MAISQALAFDVRQQAVDRWIDNLPLAHIGETARQLYFALRHVNQQHNLAARDYFYFLEQVTEPLNLILPELRSHYMGKPLPLSPKRRKVADLYIQLLRQTITGYQRVIATSIELGRFGWKKVVTTAVHRIFYFHSMLICNYKVLYQPFPRGSWQQLYWLYQLIEKNELLDSKVKNLAGEQGKTTLANEFKKILLVSLLLPNLFKDKELAHIQHSMDIWVQFVDVQALPRDGHDHVYAFCADTDVPPGLVSAGIPLHEGALAIRYFDISPLVAFIQERLRNAEDGTDEVVLKGSYRISRRILLLLCNIWGRPTNRDGERRAIQGQAELAVGVSAIHYLLNDGRRFSREPVKPVKPISTREDQFSFEVESDGLNTPSSFNLLGFATERDDKQDVWNTAYFKPENAPNWTDSTRLKTYSYLKAQVTNVSKGGYCIGIPQEGIEHIQNGEFVALRGKSGQWQLGEIRWMVCPNSGPIRAGVRRLCNAIVPAQLHLQDQQQGQALRAILGQEENRAILFLPTLPLLHSGKRFIVEYEGGSRTCILNELIHTNMTGSVFTIKWKDQLDNAADEPAVIASAQDEYAVVWASL